MRPAAHHLIALYLQVDDEAGRGDPPPSMPPRQRPELDIKVFVDFHRAQRGLIGKGKQGATT